MVATPDDLKDTYAVDPKDNDYTLVTVTDLNPGDTYNFQFAWVYKDKRAITDEDWSITKTVTASTEAQPNPPQLLSTDVVGKPGGISVRWNGVDNAGNAYKGIDRVEVFIDGEGFNPDNPVTFGKIAFQKFISTPQAGTYTVTLKAVTLLGTYSEASTSRTVTVTAIGTTIQDPTLPIGLTAESIAFGLKVNWGGAYSGGNSFSGFKSINIYAVNTDLGATTTSGISGANQVATLSVNDTANSSNIPLGTYVGYSQDTYLYYASVNENNVAYKVNGSTTYTRINSSALRPNKANFIDLADGVISIENLVAGNGQFTSWLRAGAYDGARIEISGATTSFDDPNHANTTIDPGFSIYSSGNTKSLYADTDGNLEVTGVINATSGTIGNWLITEGILVSPEDGAIISMINGGSLILSESMAIYSDGSSFSLIDYIEGHNILTTDSVNGGRIYIGDEIGNRQVELGRSAQVAGSANVNSGGLRNMYTVAVGYYDSPTEIATVDALYLADNVNNGDILLVWDPSS